MLLFLAVKLELKVKNAVGLSLNKNIYVSDIACLKASFFSL